MSSLRWGIIGTGRICNDFTAALLAANSVVTCVGASSLEKAKKFADSFGIAQAFGSYEELAKSDDVDVVYIGTIHSMHKDNALLCFKHKKHVVVEKPMALNYKQVKEMVDAARCAGVFCLEAMWTRFFPAVRKARELINSGIIGNIVAVQSDFGFKAGDDAPRLWDLSVGGGALLDIGIYPLTAVCLPFPNQHPSVVHAAGKLHSSGADLGAGVVVSFPHTRAFATVLFTLESETVGETTYIGTEGRIRLLPPSHSPTQIQLTKPSGRGVGVVETIDFPLPRVNHDLNFPNSEGMIYQIRAVEEAITSGQLETADYPLTESLMIAQTMDEIRKQLGVKYPVDD